MEITAKRIEYKYGDTIKLKPILDVHLGNIACDVKAFKKYLVDSDDKTYFIGVGDFFDAVIVTDKRYRKSIDASEGDAIIDEQVERGVELLKPYAHKILGMGSGNHEDTVTKRAGTNMIARLCKELKVPFLGFSGLFKLQLTDNGNRGRTIIIRYHHGWGGGSRTQGADLTKYSKDMAYWDADIFLYGHVHRQQTDQVPRLGLSGLKLIARPKIICICGTFLKTYTEGTDPTYSEICGYPPVSIGGVGIDITPNRHWVDIKAYLD